MLLRKSFFSVLALFCLVIAGCSPEPAADETQSSPQATVTLPARLSEPEIQSNLYEKTDCPRSIEYTPGVKCGLLSVPEVRGDPASPTLKLQVAIIPSASKEPQPDPVVMVLGPFGVVRFTDGIAYIYGKLSSQRDLIVMDLRGVSHSSSGVECQEFTSAYFDSIELQPFSQLTSDASAAAAKACRDKVNAANLHPEAYTLESSAEDLEDLRLALGYQKVNLYGTGFGTQLALIWARSHPDNIRSLTLDAATPTEASYFVEFSRSVERIFKQFFDSCAVDEKCNKAYPNLDQVFNRVVADLNAHSPNVETNYLPEGKHYNVIVNGDRLIDLVLNILGSGSPDMIGQLPQMIFEIQDGNYQILAAMMGGASGFGSYMEYASPSDSWLNINVFCAENVRPDLKTEIAAAIQAAPPVYSSYLNYAVNSSFAQCAAWQSKPVSLETRSTVPITVQTLIMAGTMDLLNPTDWSAEADKLFTGAYFLQFQGTGGIFSPVWSSCMHDTMANFIADPESMPGDTCFKTKYPITWMTFKLDN